MNLRYSSSITPPAAHEVEAELLERIHLVDRDRDIEGPAVSSHLVFELLQEFRSRRSLPPGRLPVADPRPDACLAEKDSERLLQEFRHPVASRLLVDNDDGRDVSHMPEFLLRQRTVRDSPQAASGQHQKTDGDDRAGPEKGAKVFPTAGHAAPDLSNREYADGSFHGPAPCIGLKAIRKRPLHRRCRLQERLDTGFDPGSIGQCLDRGLEIPEKRRSFWQGAAGDLLEGSCHSSRDAVPRYGRFSGPAHQKSLFSTGSWTFRRPSVSISVPSEISSLSWIRRSAIMKMPSRKPCFLTASMP